MYGRYLEVSVSEMRRLAFKAIRLALAHYNKAQMYSSAELCLTDAIRSYRGQFYISAMSRAEKSLDYSVGTLHPDNREVRKMRVYTYPGHSSPLE
jgi:hypothetical protein